MSRTELLTEIQTALTQTINELPHARTQLREWTGEHPSSTHGAAPDTTPQPPRNPNEATLTKLETTALTTDRARRHLNELDDCIDKLTALALHATITAGQHNPLKPTTRLHIIRTGLTQPAADTLDTARLKWAYTLLDRVVVICRTTKRINHRGGQNCHAHQKAGDPNVDAHPKYRHLCGWCGRFKATHGRYPPPRLVKLHDRGIRIMPSHLRRAGIRAA